MRLFFVSAASVAFSRQKAGNGIGREPKDRSNLRQIATLKKRKLLSLIISRRAKFGLNAVNEQRKKQERNRKRGEMSDLRKLDILINKSSLSVKIC
jgi:hypothetical protein